MNDGRDSVPVEIVAVVEGATEQRFCRNILAPHLAGACGVMLHSARIGRSGHKVGDVRFERILPDIRNHLRQRRNTRVTVFVDYYAIGSDWPGVAEAKKRNTPEQKYEVVCEATHRAISEYFGDSDAERRFIPYVSMHEFEALLFSDPEILAKHLSVTHGRVMEIVEKCGSPEAINNGPQTAPSKRLEEMSAKSYGKVINGTTIAQEIGLRRIREACPLFDAWVTKLESLKPFPRDIPDETGGVA